MKKCPQAKDVSLRCVCCDKTLVPLFGGESETADAEMWDECAVKTITAGYGSRFDMSKFLVGICDDCLAAKLASGVIIQWRNFIEFMQEPVPKTNERQH